MVCGQEERGPWTLEEQGKGRVTGLGKLPQGVGLHGEDRAWGGEKRGGGARCS